jgi:pentatricopeptide repeat protein
MDSANEQVRQLALNGGKVTVSIINILLSACAERGDLGRAINLYLDFENYGLRPNADTFSFIFETLGKHMRGNTHKRPRGQAYHERSTAALIVTAESFIERMEKHGVAATKELLHNYVEFLLCSNQLDKATSMVLDAVSSDIFLHSKTLYAVAMKNAKIQRFAIARQIANCETVVSRQLMRNIEREEAMMNVSHEETAEQEPKPETGKVGRVE